MKTRQPEIFAGFVVHRYQKSSGLEGAGCWQEIEE